MDNNTLIIDRDMAFVILQAFSVAEFEGMTSLVFSTSAGIKGRPEGKAYADAEFRVLELINKNYPDIAKQYCDINKQPHKGKNAPTK